MEDEMNEGMNEAEIVEEPIVEAVVEEQPVEEEGYDFLGVSDDWQEPSYW